VVGEFARWTQGQRETTPYKDENPTFMVLTIFHSQINGNRPRLWTYELGEIRVPCPCNSKKRWGGGGGSDSILNAPIGTERSMKYQHRKGVRTLLGKRKQGLLRCNTTTGRPDRKSEGTEKWTVRWVSFVPQTVVFQKKNKSGIKERRKKKGAGQIPSYVRQRGNSGGRGAKGKKRGGKKVPSVGWVSCCFWRGVFVKNGAKNRKGKRKQRTG